MYWKFLLSALILLYPAHSARAQSPVFSDSGFVLETVATLPTGQPVGLAWAPDGAMFVWQENGVVRVVKDGKLLPEPFIDLRPKVNTVNDRGLLGLALDPDFVSNGYVYLLYTYAANGNPNDANPATSRLTRVIADPNNRHVAVPGSETVILGKIDNAPCLDLPAGSDCIGSDSHSHSVGTLRFGKDRKLFVSIGDGASYNYVDTLALRSQDLNRYEGKILRINTDGSAPGDNPFDDGTQSIRSKVYAYGLRNPYRFAIEPASGELFIGDVGWNAFEEINTGRGSNFGWPCFEGKGPHKGYQDRFPQCRGLAADSVTFGTLTYGHSVGSCVIGGTFNTSAKYPAKYAGDFIFADFSKDDLWRMPMGAGGRPGAPVPFMTAANGPVSIDMGPDGMLYYISLHSGEVRRIGLFAGDPIASASADTLSGSSPLKVAFSSAGSEDLRDLPIRYLWDFGDGDTSTAPNPTHTYSPVATKTFKVTLTVANSHGNTAEDTLSVTVGSSPPQASIASPAPGAMAHAGDTVRFAGSAHDTDETLPPESMSWSVILHHDDHIHPYATAVGKEGSFVVDEHGEGEYAYDVILTVSDRTGLRDTQRVSVGFIAPRNAPPTVLAGKDSAVAQDSGISLRGAVADDGLPMKYGRLITFWSCKSEPPGGKATFSDSASLDAKAAFTQPGEYVLRLTAYDGELESFSEVRIRVTPRVPTALALAGAKPYGIGGSILKGQERYRLCLLDTQGRLAFSAEGSGSRFPVHVAEALARRAGRQVYLLGVSAKSLGRPKVIVLGPDIR